MRRNLSWSAISLLLLWPCAAPEAGAAETGKVSGELKNWHKVTIDFAGPQTGETATPNPFTDYRLDVTFRNGEVTYIVPGYYAADGNAANTSATSGNVWRVHFCPDRTGRWTYEASFQKGRQVAVEGGGASAGDCDGASGSFEIEATDKTGRDHRGKGRLQYVGERYLRFAETGEYFLKQGADAPENLFAYRDFDGDFKTDGKNDNRIKTFRPHIRDFKPGDPTWAGGKGQGLIGAINYLAAEGMNAFSFLPLNIQGDDKNVFPYLDYDERYRMDVSRLDQWEVIFEHADRLGMFIHFKTLETENELLLDGGDLGPQRKLRLHNPEFSMIELYWAYSDYRDMARLFERLLRHTVHELNGSYNVKFGEYEIDFEPEFRWVTMTGSILEKTGVDFTDLDYAQAKAEAKKLGVEGEELINRGKVIAAVWEAKVEPHLIQPTFVADFPVEISPLAKRHRQDERLTERFELFIAAQEMGNAFSELNDPMDQLQRFLQQGKALAAGDEEAQPLDDDFVTALAYGMPPTAGLGFGIDRLIMLLTDQHSIRDVIFFPQMKDLREGSVPVSQILAQILEEEQPAEGITELS